MNKLEWMTMRSFHERELKRLASSAPHCETCQSWSSTGPKCGKYNMDPPDDVYKTGCDEWVMEQIPF